MAYGSGSIFLRGRTWWISFPREGEQVNESSKSKDRKVAADLLVKRTGNRSAHCVDKCARTITVSDLLDLLEEDYVENEPRSIADLKGKIAALKDFFKAGLASEFGTSDLKRFIAARRRAKSSNATVNRYLAVLRRAFRLAAQHDPKPLVDHVPHFDLLPEHNTRSGFLEDSEYTELKSWLPDHLKGMLIFAFHLGVRKTALTCLRRDQVEWDQRIIRTEAHGGAKSQGRVLPIYGDMTPWLEMQMALWSETPSCPWIMHRDGTRIGDFEKSWRTACKAAKVPDLLFHDLRRSAVRNMERANLPRSQAMAITGHKTESIFRRYAIVAEQDVRTAGAKLERRLEAGRTAQPVPPDAITKPM